MSGQGGPLLPYWAPHRARPDQRLGSIAHPCAQKVALSPRVVSASEWVPARKELQATEEEAV
jgi:hypothetical protein